MLVSRNLLLLFVCQLISTSGTVTMVTLAGIVGSSLAPSPGMATVPVSASVVGTAIATVPAALMMRRWGRRAIFSLAAATASTGALLAAYAIVGRQFWLFVLAAGVVGSHLAIVLQYRFAAAESVSPARVGRAVSWVLLGSIGGAFLAPAMIGRGQDLIGGAPYAGTLLLLAGVYGVAALLLLGFRDPPEPHLEATSEHASRPISEILAQPACRVAILASVVAYGVMTLIMTATPLSMHLVDGFGMPVTSGVIRSHVVAMYLPSLFTGRLLERLGVGRMMMLGGGLFAITVATAVAGRTHTHYATALILLGVGWNLLFIGGTTLLTRTYRASERFKMQAVNEFSTFGASALASLLAGTILHAAGWRALVLLSLPLVALVLVAVMWSRRDEMIRG